MVLNHIQFSNSFQVIEELSACSCPVFKSLLLYERMIVVSHDKHYVCRFMLALRGQRRRSVCMTVSGLNEVILDNRLDFCLV